MPPKLGIIAGGGELPGAIIRHCRDTGREFFVIALRDQADERHLAGTAHEWVRLGAAGTAIKYLRNNNVEELVLAGSVRRPSLSALRPDLWTAKFFARTGASGLGDDGLLSALISALHRDEGFTVVGSDQLLPDLIAPAGAIGTVQADDRLRPDIDTGIAAARELGQQDVGQAVVVRNGTVIDREDASGTAALLARVHPLPDGQSGVLVKTAKPQQERRADLPTIGPDTIRQAHAAGLCGIAVEAGNAIILQKSRVIEEADRAGLFVLGVDTG